MNLRSKTYNLKHKQGYMLVELIVSISLLTVGFLGFFALLTRAIGLNGIVTDQFVANYLAMEGVEITKNLLDSNVLIKGAPWNQGFTTDGCYSVDYLTSNISSSLADCDPFRNPPLKYDSASNFYSYNIGNNSPFYRTVKITPNGNDEIKVVSTVKWTSRGGIKNEIHLEDHFFNWRPK